MESLRFLNRQAVSFALAIGILFAMIVPALIPAVVSADQLTTRSIQMSDTSASKTNVTYDITFTPVDDAGAFVIDFCKNSPVVGSACTAPDGFDISAATTATVGATLSDLDPTPADNTRIVTIAMTGGTPVNVVLDAIVNPSYVTDGTDGFYARIITYDTEGNADGYAPAALGTGAVDGGSVPLSVTSSIGISAAVRETLIFCVANQTITANCGDADTTGHEPNLTLGTGGALDSSRIDTGDIYTQITTNAASGAVINLKSDATSCGGLRLVGSNACNITPETGASGFTAGSAKFGVKTSAPFSTASGAPDATGTLQAVSGSGYNDTNYFIGYVAGNADGVTSPYGDAMLDTNAGPINNQNMKLTFGASISANTPAGSYRATLNMIATGTY